MWRLQSRRGIVLQDNNAVCCVRRLKPFHGIAAISTAKRWMKRKSARNANYRCYRTSRIIYIYFFHNNPFDAEKHRNNLNAEGRDYYEIKTAAHIRIHRATLFTRTLQTMHYHFKAGQVWFLVHTWKTGWNCVCRAIFNYIFARSAASWEREGRHKSAYLRSELVPSLPQLAWSREGRWGFVHGKLPHAVETFSEESKVLLGKRQQTSVVPNGFIQRVSPIKHPAERFLFSTQLLKTKRSWMFPMACAWMCVSVGYDRSHYLQRSSPGNSPQSPTSFWFPQYLKH